MRILVLGGTAWLGQAIVDSGLEFGHDVTCLARGQSGAPSSGARFVQADRLRSDAYDGVTGEAWDVVVDVSRHPGQVRSAVQALADKTQLFVFVSSASVYADHGTPGADESAALLPALEGDVMETMEEYGHAKVACERHVIEGMGEERSVIIRAGLIGGPGDVSGRTGYWPLRFAAPASADGRVLVPEAPDLRVQVIDVRDLARWIVRLGEERVVGVFNAMGDTISFAEHIDVARDVAQHTGALVLATQDWLLAQQIEPWMGPRSLPLWLPLPEYAGFSTRNHDASRAAGLAPRPLAETLTDTLAWELAEGADRDRGAGLTPSDELKLLDDLAP